jgi:hypothetical protein
MDYYNGAESFIKYVLSILKNISGDNIRCSYKTCENKIFSDLDVVTMYFL